MISPWKPTVAFIDNVSSEKNTILKWFPMQGKFVPRKCIEIQSGLGSYDMAIELVAFRRTFNHIKGIHELENVR